MCDLGRPADHGSRVGGGGSTGISSSCGGSNSISEYMIVAVLLIVAICKINRLLVLIDILGRFVDVTGGDQSRRPCGKNVQKYDCLTLLKYSHIDNI